MTKLTVLLVMIPICGLAQSGKVTYSFKQISTTPVAINDRGQILGFYYDESDVAIGPTLMTSDGTNLPFLFRDKVTAKDGFPTAFNTRNEFVGQAANDRYSQGPYFLYQKGVNGGAVRLQFVNGAGADSISQANGINDAGAIVGVYYANVYTSDATGVLYENGKSTWISFPGSKGTLPSGINDAGTIVGRFYNATGEAHGFVYQNGKYSQFDVPYSTYTDIHGINNLGEFIGNYVGMKGVPRGFVYSKGKIQTVNYPFDLPRSKVFLGINEEGQVSGYIGGIGFVGTPNYLSGF